MTMGGNRAYPLLSTNDKFHRVPTYQNGLLRALTSPNAHSSQETMRHIACCMTDMSGAGLPLFLSPHAKSKTSLDHACPSPVLCKTQNATSEGCMILRRLSTFCHSFANFRKAPLVPLPPRLSRSLSPESNGPCSGLCESQGTPASA